jgi:NAD(P)H-flavin reductase
MFAIIEKSELAAKVHRYVVEAPDIAGKTRPGQFVILRLDETGERIPITVADCSPLKGTITLFVQAVGKTTNQMARLRAGDSILDVVGPLGVPSRIEISEPVVAVGGGFGIAAIFPIVREHSLAGNKTIALMGARTRDLLILEEEMRQVSGEIRIATDDGSCGKKGLVTDLLQEIILAGEPIGLVIAIGPLAMMKAVADVTRPHAIKTVASLNPIMIDGSGMCGACRVMVGGEMKFACVDGPEFDAHRVDFDVLLNRLKTYLPEEKISLEKFRREQERDCKLPNTLING